MPRPSSSALSRLVPIMTWLPAYQRADLRGDVQAGLTVAVMIIPQAIAYGLLAGVPPRPPCTRRWFRWWPT
jgi:SulP family sulfate permease